MLFILMNDFFIHFQAPKLLCFLLQLSEVYGVEHFFCLDGVQACRPKGGDQTLLRLLVRSPGTELAASATGISISVW